MTYTVAFYLSVLNLHSQELVLGNEEDDVLGPVNLSPEELGGGEDHGNPGIRALIFFF